MAKRLVSFMLVCVMMIGFWGNMALAASSEEELLSANNMLTDPLDGSIKTPQGIIPLKWIGKVLSRAGGYIYDIYESQIKQEVRNWITRHFKDNGHIATTYLVGNPKCTEVKISGVIFDHTDRGNWCGNNQANSRVIVRALQKYLKELGFDPGVVDGYWGPQTRSAVIRYQRNRNLEADGIVGRETWESLGGFK